MQPINPFNPELPNDIPEVVGPFRVLRLLGAGGMGAVYLGERMEQFSQQVAIKILHPHLFPADLDSQIEREGQLLAALQHAGIVRMLDLGATANGLRYIVMEYVDGVPLDAYCDERRLPLRRRIEILLDVFEAVEHAHRHLVVHADLKPENILVTAEGKPRLLDFGVATVLSGLGASGAGAEEIASLELGESQYTALYASPEQRSGERLTLASDIYTLGLIAQFVLTGVKPKPLPLNILHSSAAATSTAVDAKTLRGMDGDWLAKEAAARATTPGGLEAAIRGDLEAILAKALQVDPRARFQSAQEMSEEFRRSLLGYPVRTRTFGRLTRVRKWALRNKLAASVGCVLLLAVLFSAVGVAMRAREAARKRQIAQTRLHDLVRLTDVLAGDLYQSLQGLEGSETAQAALLDSAHQTVDKLAAEQDHDAQLDLELAREYEKLARLEVSRKPLTAQIERRFEDDLDKEILMLNRLRPGDPEARRMRERLPAMMQLRSAAQRQIR